MSTTAYVEDAIGVITLAGNAQFEESSLRANLEDLPGVHAVRLTEEGIEVHYNPHLSHENKFYRAVRRAGFKAGAFQLKK